MIGIAIRYPRRSVNDEHLRVGQPARPEGAVWSSVLVYPGDLLPVLVYVDDRLGQGTLRLSYTGLGHPRVDDPLEDLPTSNASREIHGIEALP